jgi:transposase-like protein
MEESKPLFDSEAMVRIDLADLIEREQIKTLERLSKAIEALQARLIEKLEASGWRRSTSYQRPLVTKLGRVIFRVVKVRRGRRVFSPLIYALRIEKRKYSRDVRMLLADKASRLSYQDALTDFQNHTGVEVPKSTIRSFVLEVGRELGEANQAKVNLEPLPVVMADRTKTHSIYPTLNEVSVVIGYDPNTHRKTLLHASVNQDWNQVGSRVNTKKSSLIGDADRSIRLNLNYELRQLDLVHAVRDSLYKLWAEGMNKQERETIGVEMKQHLYTLVNSVKKHLEDNDTEALKKRIESTIKGLTTLAEHLKVKGYLKTASFIKSNARFMITFAKLALKHIKIPYTSNVIERLMGEISKRCKHKETV